MMAAVVDSNESNPLMERPLRKAWPRHIHHRSSSHRLLPPQHSTNPARLPLLSLLLFLSLSTTTSSSNSQSQTLTWSNEEHTNMMPHSSHVNRKKPLFQKKNDVASILFPGAVPEEYTVGQTLQMSVENVDSTKTQVPYDYYRLPVCSSPKSRTTTKTKRNLGQILMGHSVQPFDAYTLQAAHNMGCTPLCRVVVPSKPLTFLRTLVRERYRVHLTLDDLPLLMRYEGHQYAVRGYPLGFVTDTATIARRTNRNEQNENEQADTNHPNHNFDPDEQQIQNEHDTSPAKHNIKSSATKEAVYLYNHLRFTIYYNENESSTTDASSSPPDPSNTSSSSLRITGFHVYPVSIAHSEPKGGWGSRIGDTEGSDNNHHMPNLPTCGPETGMALNRPETWLPLTTGPAGEDFSVVYSYEVTWKKSDVKWADRWDIYLMETPDNEVHFFSIINSLMVALLLTGAVAVIMIRALKKDIREYNDLEEQRIPTAEETGWKLVHGDVFRRPRRGRTLLSVAVGTGMHVGTCVFLTLLCLMGRVFLDPMKKGQTLTGILTLYVLSGSVAGYTSARLYKYFDGTYWRRTALATAAAFPGLSVGTFSVLNAVLAWRDAATAVPARTVASIFAAWVCISTPLALVGSYLGQRADTIEVPTRTSHIARFIPPSTSWTVRWPHSVLLAGILPFASATIELYFVMGALWMNQVYYATTFAFVVAAVSTLSTSTVSMVATYLALCSEEYRWWWKSFWGGASAGLYLFLYSIWFLWTKLELVMDRALPLMVYLTYMGMICVAFGAYCGGVGVLSSFWFCRKIYGAVKVD